LDVYIKSGDKFVLSAPKNGLMERKVYESMDSELEIMLSKKDNVIYRGTARNASIEYG